MAKKLNLQYPKYAARRYAVVVKNNPHNLPVLDPAAFVLARAYLMHRDSLQRIVRKVFDEIKSNKSHPYRFVAKEYTPEELIDAITKGVKRKHGSKKLINLSGIEVVPSANATRHVLSGEVHPHSAKREPKRLEIDEYLISAREEPSLPADRLFTLVASNSSDAEFTQGKPSFDSFGRKFERRYNLMDVSAAALLSFAASRPSEVKGLEEVLAREEGLRVWMPFNFYDGGPTSFTPKQDADHVFVETLFDYYVRGRTKKERKSGRKQPMNAVDIAKRLFGIDFVYDDRTIKLVASGKAMFQVIEEEMILERASDVPKEIKDWYWGVNGVSRGGMRAFLRRHYNPEGLVLLKKNSRNEAIAESYKSKKGDDHFRVVFGDYPPLVMRLWPIPGREHEVKILYEEANKRRKEPAYKRSHPYSELYQTKQVYDDATRRIMWATLQLPQQAELPQSMFDDMLSTAAQNGVSKKELIKRMIVHDKRLRADNRGYMCTNSRMTRRVQGVF